MPVSAQSDSVSQWAETQRISCGSMPLAVSSWPSAFQLWRQCVSSITFMGLPWPRNITGMRGEGLSCCNSCSGNREEEVEFMEKAFQPSPAASTEAAPRDKSVRLRISVNRTRP